MANILNNAGDIAQNIADITGLQTTVNTNYGYSQNSRNLIEINDGDIDTNADAITSLEASVQTNSSDIAALQDSIADMSSNLAENHYHVVPNHTHAIPDHEHTVSVPIVDAQYSYKTSTNAQALSSVQTVDPSVSNTSGAGTVDTSGPAGSTAVGHSHDHTHDSHTHDAHHYHIVSGAGTSATIVQPDWHAAGYPEHNLTTSYETTNTPTAPQ